MLHMSVLYCADCFAFTSSSPPSIYFSRALSNSLSQASIASLAGRANSTPSAAGPSYSNDYLNQLKAANVSKPQSNPSNDYDSLLHEEPTSGYNDSSLARYADQDDFTMVSSSSEKLLPTQDAIAAAKARRETARRLGIDNVSSASKSEADDYISLQVGIRSSKGQSRLSKNDDEEIGGDGEDDFSAFTGSEERIALGKKGRKAMERKRKEEMRALIEGEQGDDDVLMLGGKAAKMAEDNDEDREWEMAQIRRGAAIGDDDGEPYRPAASK